MKLAAYVRVSTAEQGSSGLGLEAQRAAIESWCKAMDHRVGAWFEDVASAKSFDGRPAFADARAACESGECSGLVVLKLDRLTRSVRDLGDLMEWAEDARATIVCVRDSIDTGTAGGRMVANLLVTVSQWEREIIAERTRDALDAKRARGDVLGRAPLGLQRGADGGLEPLPEWATAFAVYRVNPVTFGVAREYPLLARPDGREWSESGWRRFRRSADLLR